jgi:two-component system, LytTR family, sensor kinase
LRAPERAGTLSIVAETPSRPVARPAALWAASFAYWTLSGLLSALSYHAMADFGGGPVTWGRALGVSLAATWPWAPLTVGIFWLARRRPIERHDWARGVAIHALGSGAVVLLRALTIYLGDPWVGWYARPPSFGDVLVTSIDHNLLLYWLFVGVAHGLHSARRGREHALRASRLEAQLTRARLAALAGRLHPHFLFNTLHSISELVHRDANAADQMIVRLADLLRRTLRADDGPEVRLAEEIETLEAYLDIERLRFGDRLSVAWHVAPDALELSVPRWSLQPLVENALRHGLAPRAAPGTLSISARRRLDRLVLEVRDDGVGVAPQARPGVGLGDTRTRLRELHGDAAALVLEPAPGGGTCARLELPARASDAGRAAA